jgi:hypothetical protein
MQSKPIVLFVPEEQTPKTYRWAQDFHTRYPEVKAVIFSPSTPPASTARGRSPKQEQPGG